MADEAGLRLPLSDGTLTLRPLIEHHREPLRSACARDPDIWQIYIRSFIGCQFDSNFDLILSEAGRAPFAIVEEGGVVGMSSFLNVSEYHRALEIGTTYLMPELRGSGLNRTIKRLMLGRAFGCGFDRVSFLVDVRNARSQAAVTKLGAVREGVLRRHLVTWNGHRRDSVVFSILAEEWRG